MSATTRGTTRLKYEAYYTPRWCVDLIVDEIREDLTPYSNGSWIEPAFGGGDVVRAVSNKGLRANWTTVDIDPSSGAQIKGDGVSILSSGKWDVCISNPPYSLAFEFAKRAVNSCKMTILLLRLGWLASAKRAGWMRGNTPSIYVIPNRPSFTKDGKTDSADYAWFVWDKSEPKVNILPTTPKHRRNRWQHQLTIFTSKDT